MHRIVLTSQFSTVAQELQEKSVLPHTSLKVAFIPTAGRPYVNTPWIEADRAALSSLGYSLFDVELQGQTAQQLMETLKPADIIFVAGGNTTYLAERAQAAHFHTIIRELLKERIYIGSSAGSILAGPSVEPFIAEDRSDLPQDFVLNNPRGLGLVDYIILPHHPEHVEVDAHIIETLQDRFTFMTMTDKEWRLA